MIKFKPWVEPTRAGNFLVRHRDGKTRLPNGRWKVFTDHCIDKDQSLVIDGKKVTGRKLAEVFADKLIERFHKGELGIVDSSESLEKLSEDYLEEKRKIPLGWKTIMHYEYSLKAMKKQFSSVQELTRPNMKLWREKMSKDGYANNTIHGHLNDARMFCNWLVYQKKMDSSPFKKENPQDKGIVPSQTKPKPRFYTTEEFMKLEVALATISHEARIGCRLAHDFGLREVEIVGDGAERLNGVLWEDITWRRDGRVDLLIRAEVTKGKKKNRKIRLDASFIALLGSRKTGPLVPLPRHIFYHKFQLARKAAGIKENLTIHGQRHTFGKDFMQRSGGNLRALADLLGHEDTDTTQIYSQFENSYLDGCMEKMHEVRLQEEALIKVAGQKADISLQITESVRSIANDPELPNVRAESKNAS